MSTRKRSRAALQPDPEDDQQDELSTTKSDLLLGADTNPLGSMKKRKLNANGSSGGGLFGIKRMVNDFFGLQEKEKENELEGDGDLDELAADGNGMGEAIYDIPASKDGARASRGVGALQSKTRKLVPGSGSKRKAADIWEVPDSDEDSNNVARGSVGKGNGSVPKATLAQKRKISTRWAEQKSTSPQATAQDAKATRRKVGKGGDMSSPGVGSEPQNGEAEPAKSSQRKGRQKKLDSGPAMSQSPAPPPLSSGRKRGRPRKNLDGIIEDAKRTPKGILTPSKGRGLKSRKSVAFEHTDDTIDLGFRDLPDSASAKASKKGQRVNGDVQEEETTPSNNDACGVCRKRRSRKGNEILFCDGCEFAVHLECYALDSVPSGEWFCRSCESKQRPSRENVEDLDEPGDGVEETESVQEDEVEEEEAAVEVATPQAKTAIAEEGEILCAICSGLDSKIGNKIILCDNCDFAVHVKCYNLPAFPKGDWFCRTCQAGAGEDPFNLGIEDEDALDEPPSDIPAIEGFEEHLRTAQKVVLDKLTGQRRIKLRGHDEEMQKVRQIVEQTVLAGEGNSMLVIGARGCGKTTLVESVISNISVDHKSNFHVVRLNGFIHTDDKIASKEIWRQLGREMEAEDDAPSKPSNYADTLASLLALLSHPSENTDAEAGQTAKSVVFILDEFDLFTTHSRQTLLYNLFDIAQARKAPIVVLGLTTKIDVVESLEKRVKSRFSHRHVHLSLPRSLPAFWETCKEGLTVTVEDLHAGDSDSTGLSEFAGLWAGLVNVCQNVSEQLRKLTKTKELYDKDAIFKQHLQAHFFRSKSVPAFFTSCILPIASLSPQNFPLTGKKLALNPVSLAPPDSKLYVLQGLSELELALLISAARLDIILDTDTCNFAMVYDEYSSLTSRHKIQTSSTGVNALGSSAKVWGRDVALGCWERLADYGLLAPVGFGLGGAGGGGAAGRMWRVDVGLEEIAGSMEGLNGIMAKWCREI